MKLIVGLGNPGKEYEGTRHNIGFSVLELLSRGYKARFKKERGVFSQAARIKIEDIDVALAMPMTYMNLSGIALKALCRKYRAGLSDLLVICDDIDLELGRLRIRTGGSSGGHRGLASIIEALASSEFARLKIGIGRSCGIDAADYVLGKFTNREKPLLAKMLNQAVDCCRVWATEGTEKSMNIYNKRSGIL